MNSKTKGDVSQLMVKAAVIANGHSVLVPYGDNNRYDFVIDYGGVKFLRCQVKTGRYYPKKGVVEFSTCSNNGYQKSPYKNYVGQIELFGVYCFDLNKVYLIPIQDVKGKKSCVLRLIPPKNNHSKPRRWASKYEISLKEPPEGLTEG